MHEAIERIITFTCDHPAVIGLLSMIWGVLAGWSARMAWEALLDEDAEETQEWLKEEVHR